MTKNIGCKKCRRLGFSVCGKEKCAVKRKPYAPGIHGRKRGRRKNVSEYGLQLREKQRMRFLYGISEKQFRNYVEKALKQRRKDVVSYLAESLESRLDNAVFKLGLAPTRKAARQMVNHGHITVNGKVVNIPSYSLRVGDVIGLATKALASGVTTNLDILLKKYEAPSWLELMREKKAGKVVAKPSIDEFVKYHNIKPIIEHYLR